MERERFGTEAGIGAGTRRGWRNAVVGAVALAASGLVALTLAQAQTPPQYDILIRGGQIIDGSGKPRFAGDVAIKDGRIAKIGKLGDAHAARVIDASGMIVSPGFIDMHTHSDAPILQDGDAQSAVRQGVTVDLIGEGESVAPRDGMTRPDPTMPWTTFTGYFDELKKRGTSINIASYVSYNQVRRAVVGYAERPVTPAELDAMGKLVARSMREGAVGLVAQFDTGGPVYPDEVIAMAKVAKSYGGIYGSHTGRQGSEEEKEFAFAIRVADEAKIPVHIYHLKVIGQPYWGTMPKFLAELEAARARGLNITANQYPYTAMSHGWNAFFPVWSQAKGPDQFLAYLADPAMRGKIRHDPEYALLSTEHGGWDGIVLGAAKGPAGKYAGMTVTQIAKARGDADPGMTAINLMNEEKAKITGVFHNQSEDDLQKVIVKPWVSVGSDGAAVNLVDPTNPHPRAYGSSVRLLGHYARDLHLLTLEEAVRKMTSLPAGVLSWKDRGLLKDGYVGDVVVFDPVHVRDAATFEKPAAYAEGVPYVIVNGVLVIDGGKHTGARPGKPVMGPGFGRAA